MKSQPVTFQAEMQRVLRSMGIFFLGVTGTILFQCVVVMLFHKQIVEFLAEKLCDCILF